MTGNRWLKRDRGTMTDESLGVGGMAEEVLWWGINANLACHMERGEACVNRHDQ